MRASHSLNLVDRRFNRLRVLEFSHRNERGEKYWRCVCDCGTEKLVRASVLTSGKAQSCGCLHRERVTAHGMTNTKTFKTWLSMIGRCTNPKSPDFHRYGGRGVQVCDRWTESFENFLSDMGERPEGKTLDRIDVNGNYEPKNCRWATLSEQNRNKTSTPKLTFNGKTKSLAEWSDEVGLTVKIISWRVKNGWDAQKALFSPLMEGRGKKASPSS